MKLSIFCKKAIHPVIIMLCDLSFPYIGSITALRVVLMINSSPYLNKISEVSLFSTTEN